MKYTVLNLTSSPIRMQVAHLKPSNFTVTLSQKKTMIQKRSRALQITLLKLIKIFPQKVTFVWRSAKFCGQISADARNVREKHLTF